MEKELFPGIEKYRGFFETINRYKKKILIALIISILSSIIFFVIAIMLLFQFIISPILKNVAVTPQSLSTAISEDAVIDEIRKNAPNLPQNPTQFIEQEVKKRFPEFAPLITSPSE